MAYIGDVDADEEGRAARNAMIALGFDVDPADSLCQHCNAWPHKTDCPWVEKQKRREEEYRKAQDEHECMEHLQSQSHEWVEPHGEPCYQEWMECGVCHEKFTDEEVDRIIAQLEAQDDGANREG